MNTYLFETTATMKEYNNDKYYINPDIVNRLTIKSENIETAIKTYRKIVNDDFYVSISNNAIKNKLPMFNDEDKQIGYVFTANTYFEDMYKHKAVIQYIDLWVEISILTKPTFEVIA